MSLLRLILGLVLLALPCAAQEYEGQTLVRMTLVPSGTAVPPGGEIRVGVEFEMAPGWHIYWENPGDAGLPTTVEWDLPPGFEAMPLEWPAPERIIEPGDIQVLAYKKRVVAVAAIRAPPGASGAARIAAKGRWLTCKEICIPGSGAAEITLPVGTDGAPANEDIFAEWSARMPAAGPSPYPVAWSESGGEISLEVSGVPEGVAADFFPLTTGGDATGHPSVARTGDKLLIRLQGALPAKGLLVLDEPGGRKAWWVGSPAQSPAAKSPGEPPERAVPAVAGGGTSLWMALLYGFLGGLILNLMPCVLPVISLKIFGFVRQAGEAPRKILAHGLAFAGGIFAWFLGLAVIVVAIKAGGGAATWAFQFQNPWFNLAISTVVFVFALNLFGVFEIVLPGKAAAAMDRAGDEGGYAGSFWQGVFATLLATPCTAPFLGTALGFAFGQSWVVIFAMFAAVASGMAAPYVALSAKPGWMKALPKPGAWMERVKQFMGFPLLATLVWLLSILAGQKGAGGVIWASAFFVCLGFSAWLYGSFCGPLSRPGTRAVAIVLGLVSAVGGGWFFIGNQFAASTRSEEKPAAEGGIAWVPFTQSALDGLLAEGRGVFLDFTADWCISCKFNERAAIDRPAVRELLAKRQIVPMKADWTNANPEITRALAAFGRVGVPFYVFYPPGRAHEPVIMPEILTEAIVLDALGK